MIGQYLSNKNESAIVKILGTEQGLLVWLDFGLLVWFGF